jgi:pimeloyl-ACP methyl ester carboxylesterase/acyl carrier protein
MPPALAAATSFLAPSPTSALPANDDLVGQILRLWRHVLKLDELGPDDSFFDHGGDSLLAMEMIIQAQALLGLELPETILFEAQTARELASAIQSEPVPATRVVNLGASPTKASLFFFHGEIESGAGYYMGRLATLLGTEQPLVSVAPHGLIGDDIPRTIEAMAADRVQLIKQEQGVGPYRLGGFCIGGLVAFEAARILVREGNDVDLLILVDPPSVNAAPSVQKVLSMLTLVDAGSLGSTVLALAWRSLARLQKFTRLSMSDRWAWITSSLSGSTGGREGDPISGKPTEGGMARSPERQAALRAREQRYEAAMARYLPAPLPEIPTLYFSAMYDGEVWRRMTAELNVVRVLGGHYAPVTTGLNVLAEEIRAKVSTLGQQKRNLSEMSHGPRVLS